MSAILSDQYFCVRVVGIVDQRLDFRDGGCDGFLKQHRHASLHALKRMLNVQSIGCCKHNAIGTIFLKEFIRRTIKRHACFCRDIDSSW